MRAGWCKQNTISGLAIQCQQTVDRKGMPKMDAGSSLPGGLRMPKPPPPNQPGGIVVNKSTTGDLTAFFGGGRVPVNNTTSVIVFACINNHQFAFKKITVSIKFCQK